MDKNIKNTFGIIIVVAVLVLAYSAWSYVGFYGKFTEQSSIRNFSVSGDGKVIAIPDVAQFAFTVITEGGKDVSSLQSENTESVNKAIAFVKSKGVEDKDIKTSYYNVSPRYQTYNCKPYDALDLNVQPCPPSSIAGYTITQSVAVKIRDFAKIGEIMTGVVENGANQIGALYFSIDDPTKVQNEARAQAVTKAKEKAQSIADAGGFKLGKIISLSEGYNYYPMYDYSYAEGLGGATSKTVPTPTIEPGSQEISVTVSIQYEIK